MDNSVKDKNRDIGDASYSSQDILGGSLAGKKSNLFTRVKKNKARPSHEHRGIKKRQIIIASIVAGVLIVAGIVAVIIVMNISKSSEGEEETVVDYVAETWDEVPDEIKNAEPEMTDEKIESGEYLSEEQAYIRRLADEGYVNAAMNRLESFAYELDMNKDKYSNCQLAEIYETAAYVKNKTGEKDEDDELDQAGRDEAAKYRGLCDAQN